MARPNAGRITYLIGRIERALRHHLAEVVERHGITVAQFTLLSVLRARGSLSNAQLAKRSFITPQSASEAIRLMEQKQWISRAADPMHGRIVRITVTTRGERLLQACDTDLARLELMMLKGLDATERGTLYRQLRRCSQNIELLDLDP